jgi:hypothetical protein
MTVRMRAVMACLAVAGAAVGRQGVTDPQIASAGHLDHARMVQLLLDGKK